MTADSSTQATRASREERARLIGLLYTAHERFTALEATVRSWSKLGSADEPGGVEDTWRHLKASAAPTRRFESKILDQRARTYHPSGERTDSEPRGDFDMSRLLLPMTEISDWEFVETNETSAAGRRAIAITAAPRRQSVEKSYNGFDATESGFDVLADSERGILLVKTTFENSVATRGGEIHRLEFADPPPPDESRWREIGEVVSLMYDARHSFDTVRMSSRRWRPVPGQPSFAKALEPKWIEHVWADGHARFRDETTSLQGTQVNVVNGGVWWRLRWFGDVFTNAPLETIDESANASVGSHRSAAYYPDAEYAVISSYHLDPSWLISRMWLTVVERVRHLGREAIRLRGEPVHPEKPVADLSLPEIDLWEFADAYDLLIDAERGVLLKITSLRGGMELETREVTAIEFDGEIADDVFEPPVPPGATVTVFPLD